MATGSGSRIILSVPFLEKEKEKAKALGARWDPQGKHWWVYSTVDLTPFRQWVLAPSPQPSIYQDLVAIDPEDLEIIEPSHLLEVFFVPWTCWRCHQTTIAFHGVRDRAIHITPLMYQAAVLKELDRIRAEFELERLACIKPRFSKTTSQAYVSQGCNKCDAVIGEFYLFEDFCEVLNTIDLATYPHCQRLDWSLFTKDPATGT